MAYLEAWWKDPSPANEDKTLADEAREVFMQRFEITYAKTVETPQPTNVKQSSIWGKAIIRPLKIKNEAEKYLSEDITLHPDNGGPNSLEYWKSVQHVYPQLSRMAMDYLAIQGSATPVERVWSAASDTDTKKRNRLGSECLAALQFLKNIYRKRRAEKMTGEEKREWQEERMRQINMEDWQNDTMGTRDVKFIDIELDLSF
ncbi:hypothetical protein M422DRAFT_23480 [Sphaerobolus stellatus SS14]|nr:hypothetical protein M422DRAFT_23480 [Sphaerobolus stellatus SS14]